MSGVTDRARIETAIDGYLSLLKPEAGARTRELKDLAHALDGLVMAYHATSDVEPDSDELPEWTPEERPFVDGAVAAFPELGWYALVDPAGDEKSRITMSIAHGDLAEIASDLAIVQWLFEHAPENDAIWEFRFGYQTHWGRHLHELRVYLHRLAAY
jgi:hypothetical protein